MVLRNLPFEDSTNISFDKDNRGADRRRGLFRQAKLDYAVHGVRSSSLFRRGAPGQGTGPEVSAAIPGDAWNQPFAGHMQFSTWRLLYLESILAVSA